MDGWLAVVAASKPASKCRFASKASGYKRREDGEGEVGFFPLPSGGENMTRDPPLLFVSLQHPSSHVGPANPDLPASPSLIVARRAS